MPVMTIAAAQREGGPTMGWSIVPAMMIMVMISG